MNNLKIFRMAEDVILPKFATEGSACFDINCYIPHGQGIKTSSLLNQPITRASVQGSFDLHPGYRALIPTGLCFDIPENHVLKIYSRSGFSWNAGIILTNSVAIIDNDYVEQVFISVCNVSEFVFAFKNGDRIAQAMLEKVQDYSINEIAEKPLTKTKRTGGFGSTGI